ncbi:MAG TPA: hypothetical protein VMW58_02475 [Anaerolineae bacterium]|nr:hypothetical protein [Anaerolineae bacterium]
MAVKKKDKEIFTTGKGMKIELRSVDPVFLQSVISSVKMPPVPTYTTTTISGRKETHKMDAQAAKETEGGEEIWKEYQEDLTRASSEQTERSLRALFLDGTVPPTGEFIDPQWQRKMEIIGVTIPDDPVELWVMYLMMAMTSDDIIRMSSHIMRLTGVDEELIQQAEDSFRDSVQAEPE